MGASQKCWISKFLILCDILLALALLSSKKNILCFHTNLNDFGYFEYNTFPELQTVAEILK